MPPSKRRLPPGVLRPLLMQAAAFFCAAVVACPPSACAAEQGAFSATAQSRGEFPAVTVLATVTPAELVFQDGGGRELRRQIIRDRTGRLSSAACAILVAPARNSFLVLFADMPELWEVSYNPSAPEIGLGMVHDFQYREGQFAPGYLHPLRTSLPSTVVRAALGQDGHSVVLELRAEHGQHPPPTLVHLDVRKPIQESPATNSPWVECRRQ
ncbi:hypothetical protein RQP54_13560 [Curvibacter sp. APW13]|uniref:hypothetical protein n=1 Tax=Curvibacter sp. APW13 TaxID=3077236 RepID=UPI0028DE6764|nr:hypothetical protein [Curvibacter sp. APW13]MDT8991893.1 hypothetical protein [Curvibacter sp. APW13]